MAAGEIRVMRPAGREAAMDVVVVLEGVVVAKGVVVAEVWVCERVEAGVVEAGVVVSEATIGWVSI